MQDPWLSNFRSDQVEWACDIRSNGVTVCAGHALADEVAIAMTEPIALDEPGFFEFVAQERPSLVFLCVHELHPFNSALRACLDATDGAREICIGSVQLLDLLMQRSAVLPFLQQSMAGLDAAGSPRPLPGYYLFRGGQLLAWSSGLPTRADATPIVRGVAIGAVWFGFTGNKLLLARAALYAANEASAARMAHAFAEALRSYRTSQRQARPNRRASTAAELDWAYTLLGVDPSANDAAVNEAWRRLRAAFHPDRAGGDPIEFERRSLLARDLNRARDVINEARQAKRRRAA